MLSEKNVFTNKYGLARSTAAVSGLITILFTPHKVYFKEASFIAAKEMGLFIPNLYYICGYSNIVIVNIISIMILLWVISGYTPQITGILHAWIAYSFFTASMIVEGGDQIIQIITILLIPVTIFDKRLNHWDEQEYFVYNRPKYIEFLCYTFIVAIKIQIAIIYLFAATGKLGSNVWINGNAFYYWFNNSPFGALNVYHTLLDWFINKSLLVPIITWGTILLELMLFASLFSDNTLFKRKLFYWALGFHIGIILIHGLFSFFFAMLSGLIIYLLPIDKPIIILSKVKKNILNRRHHLVKRLLTTN